MTLVLFPRYLRPGCVVNVAGQTVSNLGLPPPAPQGLRVAFNIKRTLTNDPDTAECSIWGLAPERRDAMAAFFHETGGAIGVTRLSIAAGYDGAMSPIFSGAIRSMDPDASPSESILTVTADDGGDALEDVPLSYSTAGWTVQNMIDVALAAFTAAGHPIAPHPSVAAAVATALPTATASVFSAAHVGRVSALLDEAARILKVRWWVRDSQLFMARRGAPVDTLAVALDRKRWLSRPTQDGAGVVRVRSFFDPNIVPGRQVTLIGRVAPGVPEPLRAEAAVSQGDTHGGSPWATDATLRRFS